jgi:hypothetical protein
MVKKKKYYGGGMTPKMYMHGGNVDPFSTKNPKGVPAEQVDEAMEVENKMEMGIPTTNAQERTKKMAMGGKIPSEHKKHHSKEHIKTMKGDMKKGDSFKKAHNKALKKVGK